MSDTDTTNTPPKVTPEMIEAGIHAYYWNKSEDWNNPGGTELRDMMRAIFVAMLFRQT
jgi:hypothetical protein